MEELEPIDDPLSRLTTTISVFEKEQLRKDIAGYVNFLLLEDFNGLVQLLYRVDVSEEKLKAVLRDNPGTDAAVLIADLLISRQEEKLKNRQPPTEDPDIPADEKW